MSDDKQNKIRKAEAMRRLSPEDRDVAIEADDDVLDGRARFEQSRIQAQLARAYRKPPPGGVA